MGQILTSHNQSTKRGPSLLAPGEKYWKRALISRAWTIHWGGVGGVGGGSTSLNSLAYFSSIRNSDTLCVLYGDSCSIHE